MDSCSHSRRALTKKLRLSDMSALQKPHLCWNMRPLGTLVVDKRQNYPRQSRRGSQTKDHTMNIEEEETEDCVIMKEVLVSRVGRTIT